MSRQLGRRRDAALCGHAVHSSSSLPWTTHQNWMEEQLNEGGNKEESKIWSKEEREKERPVQRKEKKAKSQEDRMERAW